MSWGLVDALTSRPFAVPEPALPLLVHGAERSGASFATVVLTADIVRRGVPVAFLCDRGEVVRRLTSELGQPRPQATAKEPGGNEAAPLAESRLVTMFSRDPEFLVRSLRALPEWTERVVVIKNMESTLSPALWVIVKDHPRLILSGDAAGLHVDVRNKTKSSIAFSPWPPAWHILRPETPAYVGVATGLAAKQVIVAERPKGALS